MNKIWMIAGILGLAALLAYPVFGQAPGWGRGAGACWQADNGVWSIGEDRTGQEAFQGRDLSVSPGTPGGCGRWDVWRQGVETGPGAGRW